MRHRAVQLLQRDRLLQYRTRANRRGLLTRQPMTETGQDQYRQRGRNRQDALRQHIAGEPWHRLVGQQQVDGVGGVGHIHRGDDAPQAAQVVAVVGDHQRVVARVFVGLDYKYLPVRLSEGVDDSRVGVATRFIWQVGIPLLLTDVSVLTVVEEWVVTTDESVRDVIFEDPDHISSVGRRRVIFPFSFSDVV